MKSLSKVKIADLALLYSTLEQVCIEHADVWNTLSQQEVFELVTKKCKKKINPTLIQKEVERLETFELPRNVSDSHNNRPGASSQIDRVKELITNTIGFEFLPGELQNVNESDLLRLADAIATGAVENEG